MPDINSRYEREQIEEQEKTADRIRKYFEKVLTIIFPLIAAGAPRSAINRKLNTALEDMAANSTTAIESAMLSNWIRAEERTEVMVREKYAGIQLPEPIEKALKEHRAKAARQFIGSSDLSDRIWKSAEQYRELINTQIDAGLAEGKSAYKINKSIREALRNPNKQEHPGQGVYKSPVKNAQRTARTEVNRAYRMSDQKAWEANPLILGYRVNLSATSRPKVRCELCRTLEGEYPVSFVFASWHPNCLCFKTPILMTREMLTAYNKLVAAGKDTPSAIAELQKGLRIEEPPNALAKWVVKNQERVAGWSNLPYWWKENQGVINGILKAVK